MIHRSLAALLALAAAGPALAQATVKDDGQWRAAVGAAFASTGGNTRSTTISGMADAVRSTPQDKIALYANALYASSQGSKTADLFRLGAKYDWNLTSQLYAFGLGEAERDQVAGLDSRLMLGGGAGWRFVNTETLKFEAFGGLGHVSDRYAGPRLLDGSVRDRYSHATLLAGEESTHKLGESTTARQRLVLFPNLKNSGEYRAQFDAGLALATTKQLSLTAGLTLKFNSDPGSGVKRSDTLLTTGISVRFE
jgi:putative salt-induced outer membrane protein YdiY